MKFLNKLATLIMNFTLGLIVTLFSLQFVNHIPLQCLFIVTIWIFVFVISLYEFKNDISYF